MNTIRAFLGGITLLLTLNVSAAPIAIDSMYVDNADISLTILSTTYNASTGISPAAEITMGTFQSSIFSASTTGFSLNIYSTGSYGSPVPSGTVDGTTINVDFSSFRVSLGFNNNTYDFALWPLTNSLAYGIYTPSGSTFDIGWSENLTIDLNSFLSVPASLDVNLQGYLTTVPVPAAIWLFGTGLVTLLGFGARRKKQQ